MRRQKITLTLIIILSLFLIVSSVVLAEKRSIYVGDLVQIQITSREFSVDEIREKFKDFEIVNLKENRDGYDITLRSFETGEKKVQLGDKEIVIDVKSALKEIKRVGIYEGDSATEQAGNSFDFQYIFYGLLLVFLITGGISLWKLIRKGKKLPKSPYQYFVCQMDSISENDDSYLVKLTFYFKEYIERKHSCLIRGKTSSEIISEIKKLSGLERYLPEIQFWLLKSDRFKFSGIQVSMESKQELHRELKELVRKIEETKEGELR